MRPIAFVVVLCLLLTPAVYATGEGGGTGWFSGFFGGLWEAVLAVPALVIATMTTSTATDNAPPEQDYGPMIVIDGAVSAEEDYGPMIVING